MEYILLIDYCILMAIAGFILAKIIRIERRQREQLTIETGIMAICSGLRVQSMIDNLDRMKELLATLVTREQFETAEKLKNDIRRLEKATIEAVEKYRESFGDTIVSLGNVEE